MNAAERIAYEQRARDMVAHAVETSWRKDRCPSCLGTGQHDIANGGSQRCVRCGGSRYITYEVPAKAAPRPPYPEFCRHPDKCAGKSTCQRDPCCCD